MDALIILGVVGLAIGAFVWFANGIMNDAQKRKDEAEEAKDRSRQIAINARNASPDSDLSKRVRKKFND